MTAPATPGPRHGGSGPSFSDATPAEVRAALIPEEAAEFDRDRARGAPSHVPPGGRPAS
ncbi:MAG: hypothetical protein ACRDST_21635 [Pseudonocardiaceae bacterium]